MKSNKLLLLIFGLLFLARFLCAQSTAEKYAPLLAPVKTYVVCQAKKPLVIDGKADETDWNHTPWTEDFADIEGSAKPKPLYRTRVKMLADHSTLYILAELEEPHIWATYNSRDKIIYHENDFEVFIDPDGDTHNYFEYELNALNTLLDLKMPMPYRVGGRADLQWNSKGFQSAVSLEGTLNNPADTDNKWTVEMKIPFADLDVKQAPFKGQTWKINFSRVEWRTQAKGGKYEKIINPSTGRVYPEYNWVWSPPGLINMHYPERWAMIQFSKKQAAGNPVDFKMPLQETAAKYLWLTYYKQQDFKRNKGRYAVSFEELNMDPPALNDISSIHMQASTNQFTLQASLPDGSLLSMDQTGLLQTKTSTNE